nr:hypothetical protein [Saprospiraceae bacterium]
LFEALEKPLEENEITSLNGDFTSKSGNIEVYCPSFVDNNGQSVTGTLLASFREVATKGDMIRYQTPSQTTDGKALESLGQLYVAITKDGKPVQLSQGEQFYIDMVAPAVAPGMDVFYGETNAATQQIQWEDDGHPDSSNIIVNEIGGQTRLMFFSKQLYWFSNSVALDLSGSTTTEVCATLPDDFTAENTVLYLVFENRNSVLRLGSNNCAADIPVGENVTLVALSVQGNEGDETYYLAHSSVAVSAGQQVALTPAESSISEIEAFLNGL